jgi:hypothetical protein
MKITIVNSQTGEEREIDQGPDGRYPPFKLPWLPKGVVLPNGPQPIVSPKPVNKAVAEGYKALGVSLRTVGKLFGVSCAPCKIRDAIMAKVGVFGIERANELIKRSFRVTEGTPEFDELAKEVKELIDGSNEQVD